MHTIMGRWLDGWRVACIATLKSVGLLLPVMPLIVLSELLLQHRTAFTAQTDAAPWTTGALLLAFLIWGPIGLSFGNDIASLCRPYRPACPEGSPRKHSRTDTDKSTDKDDPGTWRDDMSFFDDHSDV